jgi:hypothetical protein
MRIWYMPWFKNWMHSSEVSLGYESVDRSTFSMKRYMLFKYFKDECINSRKFTLQIQFEFGNQFSCSLHWEKNIYILMQNKYITCLKIPKGQSETVYRRRTDNTMAKRKKYKRTKKDLQNIHIKLRITRSLVCF